MIWNTFYMRIQSVKKLKMYTFIMSNMAIDILGQGKSYTIKDVYIYEEHGH
jgi:hypothetical protein